MCSVANISEETLKQNEKNSGGCHYLLKNIDYEYWEEVEKDCENLFEQVVELNKKKKAENKDYHELQIWCSDMWAVLWNLWKRGRKTEIADKLNFTWANHHINYWGINAIYHNAGINNNNNNEFYKAQYLVKKPPKDLKINPDLACYKYYEIVKQIL